MAVKTRSELIAQNTATFGNGKNTRGDDEKAFNLNHLDSFLNKKGDALENNGYVAVVDGSKLKQGTNGGIAFECAVGYDFQWKDGVAYYRPTGGSIVAAVSAVDQVPNTGFDSTIFYAVGSRFFNLVTNVQYICTNATPTSAAWSVVASGSGNVVGPGPTVANGNFAVYNGTGGLTIGESANALLDTSGNAAFTSVKVTGTAGNGHIHLRHQSSAVTGTANSNTIYSLSGASHGIGVVINNTAYASSLVFGATGAQTYTLPDLSGTVALLANAANFTTITSGNPSAIAGTLVLNNATNASTQTIRGTNPTTSIIYDLPTTAPTAGQVLSASSPSVGVSTLSWTNAGAGDMTLAGTQTVTGTKTFNAGAIRINNATNNGYHILASLAGVSGTLTATFPAATGTVPLLSLAQTWTGAQTFGTGAFAVTSAATFSGATTISASGTSTTGALTLSATTYPYILSTSNFAGVLNTPKFTTRSVGTRFVMLSTVGTSLVDYAIGVASGVTWMSVSSNGGRVSFYGGETEFGYFTGQGLTLPVTGTSSLGQINIFPGAAGTTDYQYINFGQYINQRAIPNSVTRSVGTRMVLFNAIGSGTGVTDYAIGVDSADLWINTASTAATISMYAGTTRVAYFAGTAGVALTLAGSLIGAASQDVFNTTSTTVNFAGAATALTIGATTGTATIRNAILNLSNASGQLQINSTKVVGTRITGYGTPTGGNRTLSFAAITPAEQVLAQLVADLKTHGLIS